MIRVRLLTRSQHANAIMLDKVNILHLHLIQPKDTYFLLREMAALFFLNKSTNMFIENLNDHDKEHPFSDVQYFDGQSNTLSQFPPRFYESFNSNQQLIFVEMLIKQNVQVQKVHFHELKRKKGENTFKVIETILSHKTLRAGIISLTMGWDEWPQPPLPLQNLLQIKRIHSFVILCNALESLTFLKYGNRLFYTNENLSLLAKNCQNLKRFNFDATAYPDVDPVAIFQFYYDLRSRPEFHFDFNEKNIFIFDKEPDQESFLSEILLISNIHSSFSISGQSQSQVKSS